MKVGYTFSIEKWYEKWYSLVSCVLTFVLSFVLMEVIALHILRKEKKCLYIILLHNETKVLWALVL